MPDSSRRIIVVSSDDEIRRRLAAALATTKAIIDIRATLDPVGPSDDRALWVVHLSSLGVELPRASAPYVIVMARATLTAAVEIMLASTPAAGLIVLEDFDAEQLASLANRILADDLFGLDKVVSPETVIHGRVVAEFRNKVTCMAEVAAFVESSGIATRYQEPIQQCCDEMLMNALYDAPVDAEGTHLFAGVSPRLRITKRTAQTVAVQYAFDGRRFALAVRDSFGTLERELLLRYLRKCLRADHQLDRKAGGAGVGLYLVLNSASSVYFHVLPSMATEVVCIFDTGAPRPGLAQFGFLTQSDPRGLQPTEPARALPAASIVRRRRITAAVSALLVASLVALCVAVWPRAEAPRATSRVTIKTVPQDVTIEVDDRTIGIATAGMFTAEDLEPGRIYRVRGRRNGYESLQTILRPRRGDTEMTLTLRALATVELDSQPSGSSVQVDGKVAGTTPLVLTSLVPGTTVAIVFDQPGYLAAAANLQVPERGRTTRLVQPLQRSHDFVRVRFVSEPPGAEVLQVGQQPGIDRTYTPAEIFLEAGKIHHFSLTMPRHVPLTIEPFIPSPGVDGVVKGGKLTGGATLRVVGLPGAAVSVVGTPHCQNLAVPAECTLGAGSYRIEYRTPERAVLKRAVQVGTEDLVESFE